VALPEASTQLDATKPDEAPKPDEAANQEPAPELKEAEAEAEAQDPNGIINRSLKQGFYKAELMPGEFKASVLQWNVLCDALIDGFDKVPKE